MAKLQMWRRNHKNTNNYIYYTKVSPPNVMFTSLTRALEIDLPDSQEQNHPPWNSVATDNLPMIFGIGAAPRFKCIIFKNPTPFHYL